MLYNEVMGKHSVYSSIMFCVLKGKYYGLCIFCVLVAGFQDDVCVFMAFEGVCCKFCDLHCPSIAFSQFLVNKISTFLVGYIFTSVVYFFKLRVCVLYPLEA